MPRDVVYVEDALLDDYVLRLVENVHMFRELVELKRHVVIGGLEIDAIAVYATETGRKRIVVFELKENDFVKVAEQILVRARAGLGHYHYAVINMEYKWLIDSPTYLPLLCKLLENKIGVIARGNDGKMEVLIKSRYNNVLKITDLL